MYYVFNDKTDQVLKYFNSADEAYQWLSSQPDNDSLFINKAD